ncbi:hypothetical protein KP509_03G086800 [Ceratopteris richardii]|uniref:Uncharacterized protein n=1 Tax=Ceratopteris richardii TaxID=49495 RepID=A0A8T2V5S4_CERRI|nr:hypothetical protein KP509_03G086800 [Ceratopteris richardii]
MGRGNENAGFLEFPKSDPRASPSPLAAPAPRDLFMNFSPLLPDLDQPVLGSRFQTLRYTQVANDDLSPLWHANAELKAEQSSLLLKNSELLSQTLLLKLENQQLKQQLELKLQKEKKDEEHSAASSSVSSLSLDESLSFSDNDEEVNLMSTSSDDNNDEFYTSSESSE